MAVTPVDVFFDKVKLLLHGEGADNSTVITDSSSVGRTVTAYGNAKISTAQARAGNAAIAFDGTNSFLQVDTATAISTDFMQSQGQNDYFMHTFEAWVYRTSATVMTILSMRADGGTNYGLVLGINASGYLTFTHNATTYTDTYTVIPLNTWTHVALFKPPPPSYTYTTAVNGGYSSAGSNNSVMVPSGVGVRIGAKNNGTEFFAGYMDEIRFTKGVARYSNLSVFAPPEVPYADSLTLPATLNLFDARNLPAPGAPASNLVPDVRLAIGLQSTGIGRGRIVGTVKEKHSPSDTPVVRRVRLFDDRSGVLYKETWSDAATGAYAFDYIDEGRTYTVLSYDHTLNFRAVVADRITPEIMG